MPFGQMMSASPNDIGRRSPTDVRDRRFNKTTRVKLLKVSVKPFQRLAQVEGVKPSSRSAEREIPLAAKSATRGEFQTP